MFVYIGELCRYLVNHPPGDDDRRHKLRLAFGNGLRPDVWDDLVARFAIPQVLEFYGSTEGNVSMFNFDGKPGSIGRVPPYMKNRFHIRLVEVDTETGKVTIEQVVSAVDAGKAVNPRQCHMQNEGSMIMSLGSALFEEMVFDNGQPINSTFLEYMPPSMEDHPRRFESVLVETPHPEGPFGAKGVGEAALGPVEPAIGNAVANALGGIRLRNLPLRPDRVVAGLRLVKGERV